MLKMKIKTNHYLKKLKRYPNFFNLINLLYDKILWNAYKIIG